MELARFPRTRLAVLPTPLHPLPRLTAACAGPKIFVKRDDLTGLATGGNKTRKLEFSLGAALDEGADSIITTGGYQSNHACQTAAAAARLGLSCDLILTRNVPLPSGDFDLSGNLLLDRLLGARVHLAAAGLDRQAAMEARAEALRREGRKPFIIPIGASDATGSLGYVLAALEILNQAESQGLALDYLIAPTSSGGTLAGLAAGFDMLGHPIHLIGVDVDNDPACLDKVVLPLIAACKRQFAHPEELRHCTLEVVLGHAGEGYGHKSAEMRQAVETVARSEGLLLDPVYSGKAMAALLSLIRAGRFNAEDSLLFLHTGGVAGLFGYKDYFA